MEDLKDKVLEVLGRCYECGSKELEESTQSMDYELHGENHVIENIPAIVCTQCKEVYLTPVANREIDRQIGIIQSQYGQN